VSFVIVNQLTRLFDLSKPWIVRTITGQKKRVLTAVDCVNFQIEKGETYALVGESGSGKSTIAKMVAGLLMPTSGSVIIDNKNFNDANLEKASMNALRRKTQMVFQSPYASLNPRWKIGNIINEPIKAFGLIKDENDQHKRVIELLEQVGLSERDIKKYPHEFSGGQRQRISIARALATEPEIIICDEPTSALDVSVQAQVLNLLKDLQKNFSLTYLFISHDLAVISTMANNIGVLKEGVLVEQATPNDLFHKPQHDYTKMLLAAAPNLQNN
jgi:peptide/nickel transport system ATP-binding protein